MASDLLSLGTQMAPSLGFCHRSLASLSQSWYSGQRPSAQTKTRQVLGKLAKLACTTPRCNHPVDGKYSGSSSSHGSLVTPVPRPLKFTRSFSPSTFCFSAKVIPRLHVQLILKSHLPALLRRKLILKRLAAIEPAGGKGRNRRIPTLR